MDPAATRRTILEVLATIAPEADASTLPGDADLRFELDLDSMDFLNLVEGVGKVVGREIPERDYPRLTTLDDFAVYLAG